MEKLYIVHWGSATLDDRGNASAHSGVHGVYKSLDEAKTQLVDYKENVYLDAIHTADGEVQVYGSESEEYFEVDFTEDGIPYEVYISIKTVELN
jgi:hypothetical protein